MSAENTPILSGAIPAFELFKSSWETMVADRELRAENVAHFIKPGLDIAAKYYNRFGDTDAYIISMCKCSLFFFGRSSLKTQPVLVINPSIRLEWIKQNWSPPDQVMARKIIYEKVFNFIRALEISTENFKA
jgi:hypothetical protein